MLPEWNIKGIIIETGGFPTEWHIGSMVRLPPLTQYDTPHSSMTIVKQTRAKMRPIGDPARAAKAMVQVADMADLPLRVQLGTDAMLLVRNKALKTVQDGERLEAFSSQTDADDVDKNKILQMFTFANE